MKIITLFGEILLFVPILVLIFLINKSNINNFGALESLINYLQNYIPFFSKEQIFIGVLLGFAIILQEIIGGSIKFFFFKDRPNPMKYTNWYEKVLAGSFPSLHSARTFLLVLFAYFFAYKYVWLGFFIFWIVISYSRIHLKKHFCYDIFGGAILASLIFSLIFSLFS